MPVDASIPLQVKQVEMPNPLDSAVKALTMKNLLQENQSGQIKLTQEQRAAADNQSVRDAFKNNSSQGPDGSPVVNRQGIMKDLYDRNPQLAQKQDLEFKQLDLENLNRQHQIAKSILFDVTPGDQASVDRAYQMAKQYNLPALDNVLPKNANDPNFGAALRQAQMKSLTAEEQLAQMNKQTEFQMQQQKTDIEKENLALSRQKYSGENVQQTLASLQSARGNPAVQQAEKDVYAAQKIKTLLKQYPDADKMPPQMVNLVVSEVAKVAQGGAPTEGEFEMLKPDALKGRFADSYQKLMNHPTGATAGAFLKQYADYADGVAGDAKDVLRTNYQGVIESKKRWLPKGDYEELNKQFLGRLNGKVAPGTEWSGQPPAEAKDDNGQKSAQKKKAPEGATKDWNGKTYKLIGDHWVSQTKQAAQ